jgi:serine/threonine protein kinase
VEQIGRYQILDELGRGAMGIVYKAQDPAIGRTIAIKSIRLQDLSDEAERERLRERLFREAQSAGILSHPGIVTIYDIAEENGLAYIFMEFVNGPPLEKMLRQEQTPDKETLSITPTRRASSIAT